MPYARSARTHRERSRRSPASRLASELFCYDVLQDLVLKAEVGKHALELAVLLLKLLEAFDVRSLHAPILGFPFVVRGLAYTVFSADIGYRAPTFSFLQNPNDLTFRESRFLHCRLLEGSLPEISTMRWSYFRGRLHMVMQHDHLFIPHIFGAIPQFMPHFHPSLWDKN